MTRKTYLASLRIGLGERLPLPVKSGIVSVERRLNAAFGRAPRFAIVGCPRSGTKFAASSLLANGVSCGHEKIFAPHGYAKSLVFEGDSSWLAPPLIPESLKGTLRVFHQVRDPIAVISSFLGIDFFTSERSTPERRFLHAHFETTGDSKLDAMRFYLEWNQRCEDVAEVTYRVEDFPAHLDGILAAIRSETREKVVLSEALRINARKRSPISWDDLPDGREKARLRDFAARFDYL